MKWKTTEVGDKRTKTRFLFFPKNIDGETRWLQSASWTEMYIEVDYGFSGSALEWQPIRWLENLHG